MAAKGREDVELAEREIVPGQSRVNAVLEMLGQDDDATDDFKWSRVEIRPSIAPGFEQSVDCVEVVSRVHRRKFNVEYLAVKTLDGELSRAYIQPRVT